MERSAGMPLITTRIEGGVCALAFNRPEALNAFTPELLTELVTEIAAAERNPAVSVIILRGEGRAFSAGVDLKVLKGAAIEAGRVGGSFDGVAATAAGKIRRAGVPVIAEVHGFCFTGALELALHCDFIYATADAKFGDTHAKWGLRPTWGMSQNLARAVGVRRARELSYTARTFSGADAARWGLVNETATDQPALRKLVDERAAVIAAASRGAVAAYKKLYAVHEEDMGLAAALAEELRLDFPEINDTMSRLGAFGA